MGRYSFRNGKLTGQIEARKEFVVAKDPLEPKGVAYIKLQTVQNSGTAGAPDGYAYLYLGTAGHLMLSSTAPVGTTGAFVDVGARLGTTA